jgi:hypothetical protein
VRRKTNSGGRVKSVVITMAFISPQAEKPEETEVRASQHFQAEAYWATSKVATHTFAGREETSSLGIISVVWRLCETRCPWEKRRETLGAGSFPDGLVDACNFNLIQKLTCEYTVKEVRNEATWMSKGRTFQAQAPSRTLVHWKNS